MLALLLAVALIGLTVLSLLLAGAVVAAATAIAMLNLGLVAFGLRARRPAEQPEPSEERWRPSAFGLPAEPPVESDDAPQVTVERR